MICTYQTSIRRFRLFGCSRPPYNHHQQSVSQLWCLYKQNQHVNIEYYHINKQLKQTWISAEIRCPMPDQKPMWTRCLGGFSVMWVTKLLISPVKKKDFLPQIDQISLSSTSSINISDILMKIYLLSEFGPLLWVSMLVFALPSISSDYHLLNLCVLNLFTWFII